jgi:hypothetical protein
MRPVNPIRRALPLLALLAACGTPAVCAGCGSDGGPPIDELPAAFRVEAEIVSVTGPFPHTCTPTMDDVNPDGPDWQLEFLEVDAPTGPKVGEVVASRNGYRLTGCDEDGDCCEPPVEVDGGWSVTCQGIGTSAQNVAFEFVFFADGGGVSTTTLTVQADGAHICTAVAEWPAIITP